MLFSILWGLNMCMDNSSGSTWFVPHIDLELHDSSPCKSRSTWSKSCSSGSTWFVTHVVLDLHECSMHIDPELHADKNHIVLELRPILAALCLCLKIVLQTQICGFPVLTDVFFVEPQNHLQISENIVVEFLEVQIFFHLYCRLFLGTNKNTTL